MIRFIHTADIHLDSPLRGLESYEGAPAEALRLATRQAFERVIDLCLSDQVDFLVIAGDLFDTDVKDFNAALAAASQLRRLHQAGIPAYLILGNHDSRQEMTRHVPWPPNVTLFDHKRPQTVQHATLPVAVHGMSYPKREVTQNLVPQYPAPVAGCFNIGLLHTNATGNERHASYAPCSVRELAEKGYDYWALGHVHDFQVLHEQPHIVYCGNTQGRNVRETGTKGCLLVTAETGPAGWEIQGVEFRETDHARWFHQQVVLTPEDDAESLLDRARAQLAELSRQTDGRLVAVRLEITGRSQVHTQLAKDHERQQMVANLRSLAADVSEQLWIEKIKFRTQSPLDRHDLRDRADLVGQLVRDIDALAAAPAELCALADAKEFFAKVMGELNQDTSGGDVFDPEDPAQQAAWLRDAEALLLSQLVQDSGSDH